jgi:hypothetical protein
MPKKNPGPVAIACERTFEEEEEEEEEAEEEEE